MRFVSTRGGAPPVHASAAMLAGLAPDGGLYVPERYPAFEPGHFDGLTTLPEVAAALLAPFFSGDPLEESISAICTEAFDFPVPLEPLGPELSLLELYWGPTAAFKDIGARFLASSLSRTPRSDPRPLTVLVATSGDTGGAVAAAFHRKPGIEVAVLFPEGRVSALQEQQLTCWGENIHSLRVRGAFDDCQHLVKAAFAHPWWREHKVLTSANSINIGRLLPQMTYYAWASLQHWRATGEAASFAVPTGNAGNVCAALWARRCGLPIGQLTMATNANRVLGDFWQSGAFEARPSLATLANAMDVGNPSNLERIRHAHGDSIDQLRGVLAVDHVLDAAIEARIRWAHETHGAIVCPHTACGIEVAVRRGGSAIVAATAHAAKFATVVEPLLGIEVELPPALAQLMGLPSHADTIDPTLSELRAAVSR